MARVISRDSICKANDRVNSGNSFVTGRDRKNVAAHVCTSFGTKTFVVSKRDIVAAASSALKEMK